MLFFSLSLDEVNAVDTSSWICMNVYTVQNHVRNVHLLTLSKMKESASAENLYNIVMNTLCDISGLDGVNIARNLVCFGEDGAL